MDGRQSEVQQLGTWLEFDVRGFTILIFDLDRIIRLHNKMETVLDLAGLQQVYDCVPKVSQTIGLGDHQAELHYILPAALEKLLEREWKLEFFSEKPHGS
jgi:hypothetical protein